MFMITVDTDTLTSMLSSRFCACCVTSGNWAYPYIVLVPSYHLVSTATFCTDIVTGVLSPSISDCWVTSGNWVYLYIVLVPSDQVIGHFLYVHPHRCQCLLGDQWKWDYPHIALVSSGSTKVYVHTNILTCMLGPNISACRVNSGTGTTRILRVFQVDVYNHKGYRHS